MHHREYGNRNGYEKANEERDKSEKVDSHYREHKKEYPPSIALGESSALFQRLDRSEVLIHHEIECERKDDSCNDPRNDEEQDTDTDNHPKKDGSTEEAPEAAWVPEVAKRHSFRITVRLKEEVRMPERVEHGKPKRDKYSYDLKERKYGFAIELERLLHALANEFDCEADEDSADEYPGISLECGPAKAEAFFYRESHIGISY